LSDNVVIIDMHPEITLISIVDDTFTFSYTGTPPNIHPGTILLSSVGNGYLRKVESVQEINGTLVMLTSQASLENAFEELHLSEMITLDNDINQAGGKGASPLVVGSGKSINIQIKNPITGNPLIFSGANDYDVSVDGHFQLVPSIELKMDIIKQKADLFTFVVHGNASYGISANMKSSRSLSVTGEKEVFKPKSIFFKCIPVPGLPICVPVSGEFNLNVGISLISEGSNTIRKGFNSVIDVSGGCKVDQSWNISKVSDFSYTHDPFLNVDYSVAGSGKVYVRPKFGLYIFGVLGPTVDFKPYGKGSIVIGPDPHLEAGIGIAGNVGGELKILSKMIGSVNLELFDLYYSSWTYPINGPVFPPTAPSNLQANDASSSAINLTWTDASNNEDGFRVYRLTPSTTYYYKVTAYNSAGESAASNVVSVTTNPPLTIPSAPTNLQASAASSTQINLIWTDASNNESGFKVYRGSTSNDPGTITTLVASLGAGTTSYQNTGLAASTTYYYKITAYNSAGESVASNVANATTTISGALSVSPTGDLVSSGPAGGAFSPSSINYTLSNPGGTSINWTASKTQSWVDLSSTGGTLSAGGTATVTVSINSNANSLGASSTPYTDAVTFTNTTNGTGNTVRSIDLTVGVVSPGWDTTDSMSVGRYNHTATLLPDGRVLVAGGLCASVYFDSAEIYDPSTGMWSNALPMANRRYGHTSTLLNDGKVLVAGGYGGVLGYINYQDSAELYDPTSGTWSDTGIMNERRDEHTATLLNNGKVLVAGGRSLQTAELYDPSTELWSWTTGPMSTPRRRHTATLLHNGKVLVAGGLNGYAPLKTAELYDPGTGIWSPTAGSMSTEREGHTATLLPNGKVLVTGGLNGTNLVGTSEIYDPGTGLWSPTTETMLTARGDHTATLLPVGVLVAGGWNGTNYNSVYFYSAEIFDPSAGNWSETTPMVTARAQHTSTLLNNGKVLVAGGHDSWCLDSAELYSPGVDVISVSISPPTASLVVGQAQQFTATVTGSANQSVTWSVQEGPTGGTVTSGGYYTASNIPGTYHIVATSQADSTKSAVAIVTVTSLQSVEVAMSNWIKTQCGPWENTTDGLKVYGTDYRFHNIVLSRNLYNFIGKELYIKWKANGGGSFSQFGPGIFNVFDLVDRYSTYNACCETYTNLITDDIWYYSRIRINSDKTFDHVTCTGNYDTLGGTPFFSETGNISDAQWQMIEKTNISFRSRDQYSGVNSYFILGEVMTDASQVVINTSNPTFYNFEDGLLPLEFNVLGNWLIDNSGYNSSKSLYINTNQNSTISLGVNNADAVSFKIKVSMPPTGPGNYWNLGGFGVNSYNYNVSWTGDSISCWNDISFGMPDTGINSIFWGISSSYGSTGQLWIDDIRIDNK
jgi:hypothetical protein